jgi:rubrerythrin
MDRFVRHENVKHYRELLKTVKDEAERQRILALLAEEQKKQRDAGDPTDER